MDHETEVQNPLTEQQLRSLQAVRLIISRNPHRYNQYKWINREYFLSRPIAEVYEDTCDTKLCVAGWLALIEKTSVGTILDRYEALLGLFYAYNITTDEVLAFLDRIIGGEDAWALSEEARNLKWSREGRTLHMEVPILTATEEEINEQA